VKGKADNDNNHVLFFKALILFKHKVHFNAAFEVKKLNFKPFIFCFLSQQYQ